MLALMLMPFIISSRQRLGLVASAGLGLLCCARRLVGLLHLLACNWRTRQRLGQGPGSGPQEALLAVPPTAGLPLPLLPRSPPSPPTAGLPLPPHARARRVAQAT